MWYILVILSVLCVGFSIWVRKYHKKHEKSKPVVKDKPPFRTEDVLEEYGKPMKDKDQPTVDLDDAE